MTILKEVLGRLHVTHVKQVHPFADGEVVLVQLERHVGTGKICRTDASQELTVLHHLQLHPGDTLTVVTPEEQISTEVLWTREEGGEMRSGVRVLRTAEGPPERLLGPPQRHS